jgi:hypothetical protein
MRDSLFIIILKLLFSTTHDYYYLNNNNKREIRFKEKELNLCCYNFKIGKKLLFYKSYIVGIRVL